MLERCGEKYEEHLDREGIQQSAGEGGSCVGKQAEPVLQ